MTCRATYQQRVGWSRVAGAELSVISNSKPLVVNYHWLIWTHTVSNYMYMWRRQTCLSLLPFFFILGTVCHNILHSLMKNQCKKLILNGLSFLLPTYSSWRTTHNNQWLMNWIQGYLVKELETNLSDSALYCRISLVTIWV